MRAGRWIGDLRNRQHGISRSPEPVLHVLVDDLRGAVIAVQRQFPRFVHGHSFTLIAAYFACQDKSFMAMSMAASRRSPEFT